MLVYSVLDRNSFLALDAWVTEVAKHAQPKTKMFLVGNKCDDEDKREVSFEEGLVRKRNNRIGNGKQTANRLH